MSCDLPAKTLSSEGRFNSISRSSSIPSSSSVRSSPARFLPKWGYRSLSSLGSFYWLS